MRHEYKKNEIEIAVLSKKLKIIKPGEAMEISRSKWDNFIKCPAFYLKEKHNIDPPSTSFYNKYES